MDFKDGGRAMPRSSTVTLFPKRCYEGNTPKHTHTHTHTHTLRSLPSHYWRKRLSVSCIGLQKSSYKWAWMDWESSDKPTSFASCLCAPRDGQERARVRLFLRCHREIACWPAGEWNSLCLLDNIISLTWSRLTYRLLKVLLIAFTVAAVVVVVICGWTKRVQAGITLLSVSISG